MSVEQVSEQKTQCLTNLLSSVHNGPVFFLQRTIRNNVVVYRSGNTEFLGRSETLVEPGQEV
jgi:hypothetical protein